MTNRTPYTSLRFFSFILLCITAFIGCQSGPQAKQKTKELHTTNVHTTVLEMPRHITRVAALPVHFSQFNPYTDDYLDITFNEELVRHNLFEIIPVSRKQLRSWFQSPQIESTEILPAQFFEIIQEKTGAQGVILTDLTSFKPYQPITMNVRSKLIDISSGEIVWAADDIFDGGEPAIHREADRFHVKTNQNGTPGQLDQSYLYSPRRFSKFVAYNLFVTLPKRFSP